MRYSLLLSVLLLCLLSCQESSTPEIPQDNPANWSHYLGDPATSQFSKLDQITRENVAQLKVAWTYESGDSDSLNRSQIQCNPLVIDGVVYGTNPNSKCFAINAETGAKIWTFDPAVYSSQLFGMGTNRGLNYWTDGVEERIYYSAGSRLYALDAKTGQPIIQFAEAGSLDLHKWLGDRAQNQFYVSNSPGVIFEDKLIMGGRVSESLEAAPGHIRAINIHTGELEWMFHTIPYPGEAGYDSWPADAYQRIGGANAWSGLSLDEERGWVFVPTGSASYDFYGGDRHGDNLYANCVIALNARTGEKIWHYQTVHHDVWDRDLPATPILITVAHEGKMVDAIAQTTKSGWVFVLDRETGEPLFPVEEKPVPASALLGERSAPTQPIPSLPPPFTRQVLTAETLYDLDEQGAQEAKAIFDSSVSGGPFIPPTEEGTIIFPGFDGGAEWGGAAYHPSTHVLYVNANEMPWMLKMNPVSETAHLPPGQRLYRQLCQSCHGAKLEGGGVFQSPSLVGLKERLDHEAVQTTIYNGKGVMPNFAYLDEAQIDAIANFLLEAESTNLDLPDDIWPYPYTMDGYTRLKTSAGHPIVKPPWGTLSAIDLDKGEILWQVPLGEHPDLVARGIRNTGSENYGGPVLTASNVLFIAATLDEKIRAFDAETGKVLWEAQLPAAGYATPAVYSVNDRQYVLIACGGGKLGTPSGDQYIAFALPE